MNRNIFCVMSLIVLISLISLVSARDYDPIDCSVRTGYCYMDSKDGTAILTNNPRIRNYVMIRPKDSFEPILEEGKTHLDKIGYGTVLQDDDFVPEKKVVGAYDKWLYNFSDNVPSLTNGVYVFHTKLRRIGTAIETVEYTFTDIIDITPPTIDNIDLYENELLSDDNIVEQDSNITIKITATDDDLTGEDDTGVIGVNISIDGIIQPMVYEGNNIYSIDILNILSLGEHTARFYAQDNLTNLNDSITYTFSVNDTKGPDIEVIYPKTGVTYLFRPTIIIETSEPATCDLSLYKSSYIGQFTKEIDNTHSLTLPATYQLMEGQIRSFNISCIDLSNNPNSLKFDILLDTIAPEIHSLTLTRPSPIYSWDDNNKITSLRVVTTKDTICKQKGYEKIVGDAIEPTYEDMNYFSDLTYKVENIQDITQDIIDLGINGDFKFYVMCEAKNGLKTTLNFTDFYVHVGELFWVEKSPSGIINNKDPLLYIKTNLICNCEYDDGSGFTLFGGRFEEHGIQLHLTEDGDYSYPIRCYTGDFYLATDEDYRFETTISFILDTATPKPQITSIRDSLNNEVMNSRTNDTNLAVYGTAESNATIITYVKDSTDVTVYTNITISEELDGDFIATIILAEIDGRYSIYSQATDAVGNQNISDIVNVTLDKTGPIAPIIWQLPSEIEDNIIDVIGYANESDVTVYIGASEYLRIPKPPYINSEHITYNSNLIGIIQAQDQEGDDELVVSETFCNSIDIGNFVWFDTSNLPYFRRYAIINKEPGWLDTCIITLSPPLTQNIVGKDLFIYDTIYPSGWFNISIELIPEIENYITAYAEDDLGNIGDEAIAGPVYFHINPPVLYDIPPVVGQAGINISGHAKPLSNIIIYRNTSLGQVVETPTESDSDGEFSEEITLTSGENYIYAVIVDQSDHPISERSNELIVIYDDQDPVFEDHSPIGTGLSRNNVEIVVYAWDNIGLNLSTLSLKIDNNEVDPFYEEEDLRLRINYTVASFTTKDHVVNVSIKDLVGNIGEYSWTFTTYIPPQCVDGIDNDEDNLTDYMLDPGCDSQSDDDESNPDCGLTMPQCWDCIDNDGDSLVDYMRDLGCDNYLDDDETDVTPHYCGDGTCDADEDCASCEADCGVCDTCGDGYCVAPEDCSSCEQDCGTCAGPYCGDGTCDADEDCASCEADCGVCDTCGDGYCVAPEDCSSCEQDCGVCPAQCSDGIDNDEDGLIDYGFTVGVNDPGCDSLTDDDETDFVGPPNIIEFKLNDVPIRDRVYFNETVNNISWTYETEVTLLNKVNIDGTDYDTGWVTQDNIIYFFDITLDSGSHVISFTATNLVAETTQTLSFYVDTIDPTITIDNWNLIGTQYIDIDGSCGDNLYLASIELFVDGTMGEFPLQCVDGYYKAEQVNLGEDRSHTITVIAKDRAGNSNSTTIVVDTGVPEINITNIIGNGIVFGNEPYKTNSNKVTIRGTYFDENFDSIDLMLNNNLVQSPELYTYPISQYEGEFEVNVTLVGISDQEFVNNITIIANDTSGFEGRKDITIIKDLRGPLIVEFEPETKVTDTQTPTIKIMTNEYTDVCSIIYITELDTPNTQIFATEDNRNFTVSISVNLKDIAKVQNIDITCNDSFSNVRTETIPFWVDLLDPSIESFDLVYPQKIPWEEDINYKKYLIKELNTPPDAASISLIVRPSEYARCEYYGSRWGKFANYEYFSGEMQSDTFETLEDDGEYTFNIVCEDKAGRLSGVKVIDVVVDSAHPVSAPVIELDYPEWTGTISTTRSPTFNGSIISLTPDAYITESKLIINSTIYDLTLDVEGKFSETINPLPADDVYSFTILANNSAGNITIREGSIMIDTTGPGGCITVGNVTYCTPNGNRTICGDEIIEGAEECDSGDLNGNDFCSTECKFVGERNIPVVCQFWQGDAVAQSDLICNVEFGKFSGTCLLRVGGHECTTDLLLPSNANQRHYAPHLYGALTGYEMKNNAYNGNNYFVNFD